MKFPNAPVDRCWAIVNLDAILQNISALRNLLPKGCSFLAVVKGAAYGHGMIPIAHTCAKAGVQYLGTATLGEAIELRKAGITLPILILGVTAPAYTEKLVHYQLTQIVPSLEYAKELAVRIPENSQRLKIHLKVDTGMGRLGWQTEMETLPSVCKDILKLAEIDSLYIEGVMTHLSSSRGSSLQAKNYTNHQLTLFRLLCAELKKQGLSLQYQHALNSGGLASGFPLESTNMVRIGHLLYDSLPGVDRFGIKTALELKTTIASVKSFPSGAYIGYGQTYKLSHPARIGVLNIGSCDGYPACLSNKGEVLLHGIRVPIVGSVCMDQCMVDITSVPDAEAGDVVTIVGCDGKDRLSMFDISKQSGGVLSTIFSTGFRNRITRYYVQDGELVGKLQVKHSLESIHKESEEER